MPLLAIPIQRPKSQLPPFTAQPAPHFDFTVSLEGVNYTIEIRWNVRDQAWYRRVLNESADTVIRGDLKLVVSFPIDLFTTGRQPAGLMILQDTSGTGVELAYGDLGARGLLFYIPAADLA